MVEVSLRASVLAAWWLVCELETTASGGRELLAWWPLPSTYERTLGFVYYSTLLLLRLLLLPHRSDSTCTSSHEALPFFDW